MFKAARTILSSAPLVVMPAYAADGAVQTGISDAGPARFIFTLAAALVLTLVFRSTARHLTRFAAARIGRWRIRTALAKRSTDVLHDFILPGAYGGLVKIDHAMLTAGGILCIQAKHYNGVVLGDADEAQWTNIDGVERRRFLNPVIQNEGRSRALQKVVPDVPVANLVIFTGSIDFTSPLPDNVIHVRDLESYVARFVFGPTKFDDWDAVWLNVKAAALTDEATRKDLQAQLSFS